MLKAQFIFLLYKALIDTTFQAKSHREKELKTAEEEVKKSKKKAEESTKNMKAKQQVTFVAPFNWSAIHWLKHTQLTADIL